MLLPLLPFLRRLAGLVTCALAMAAHAGELVVTQVAPFTGGVAAYSNQLKLGASALFDAVNDAGGINGSKIRLVTRDDRLDAQVTVAQFEESARVDRPVAFLYPVGPLGIAALLEQSVPQRLGIPVVGTVPAMYKLRTPINPFVFHVGLGDDAELAKIVQHIATLGIRRIGVIHWNEPSALEAIALIEREARAQRVDVVMKGPVEPGTDKVEPALLQVNKSSPAALIAILPVHATGALVKGLREANNGTPVYGPSYTESFLLAQVAGEKRARGVGVSQVVPNPFAGSIPLVREYQQHMRRFAPPGTPLSTLSLQGYIAAKVVCEGLRRTGNTPTPARLRDALETLKGYDLGGLFVHYSAQQHVGLKFLDIGVVAADGRLLY